MNLRYETERAHLLRAIQHAGKRPSYDLSEIAASANLRHLSSHQSAELVKRMIDEDLLRPATIAGREHEVSPTALAWELLRKDAHLFDADENHRPAPVDETPAVQRLVEFIELASELAQDRTDVPAIPLFLYPTATVESPQTRDVRTAARRFLMWSATAPRPADITLLLDRATDAALRVMAAYP